MLIRFASAFVAVILLTEALPAQAGCPIIVKTVHDIARDWQRNNCWPQPFLCPDRLTVRAPFDMMVQNGWRRQNLLADEYFEPDSGQLNAAGEEKVRWILTEAPEQHRTIFVRRARDSKQTAARLAAVNTFGAKVLEGNGQPSVSETNLAPVGWPADRVDVIERKFQDSMPAPRLPATAAAGSGGT